MRRLASTIIVLAIAPLLAGDGGSVSWTTDPARALKTSEAEAKPVLADVWAVWCAPCKKMDETTYGDPRVVRAAGGFVPLKVDADANVVFIERHRVSAYPTVLFLDHEGGEILRMTGFVSADVLHAAMQRVHEGYAAYAGRVESVAPADLQETAAYLVRAGNPARAAERLRRALKACRADGRADPPVIDSLELALAEAKLAAGEAAAAAKLLQRLADSALDPAIRGRALVALVRAERQRGRRDSAERTLARLAAEHPDLVRDLE